MSLSPWCSSPTAANRRQPPCRVTPFFFLSIHIVLTRDRLGHPDFFGMKMAIAAKTTHMTVIKTINSIICFLRHKVSVTYAVRNEGKKIISHNPSAILQPEYRPARCGRSRGNLFYWRSVLPVQALRRSGPVSEHRYLFPEVSLL